MLHKQLTTVILAIVVSVSLSGCFDLFALPNISVSSNDEWVALLSGGIESDETELIAINMNTQETVTFDVEGFTEGAFDWHPDGEQIAFYAGTEDADENLDNANIYLSNVNTPETVSLIAEDLGGVYVTQLAFSPDGTTIAFSALSAPEDTTGLSLELEIGGEELETEGDEPVILYSALYTLDVATGEVIQHTDVVELFPSVIAWSPDSSKLGFTAWNNGDGDDFVNFGATGLESGDGLGIYYLDLADGNITRLTDDFTIGLSPSWLDDTTLAYVSLSLLSLSTGDPSGITIDAYDTVAAERRVIVNGTDIGTGTLAMSVSPTGDRIAFIGQELDLEGDVATSDDETDDAPPQPGLVYVMNADGSDLQLVYEVPPLDSETSDSDVLLDVPVWSADGTTLYLSAGGPIGSLTASFATSFNDTGASAAEVEVIPVVALDLANPDNVTVIYDGTVFSPGLFQAIATFVIGADDSFEE